VAPVDPMVQCPYCIAMVRQSRLAGHQAKVHAAQLAAENAVSSSTRSTLITSILHTLGKSVKVVNTPPEVKDQTTQQSTVPSINIKQANNLTTCPFCAVSVRMDRLDRHLRKVHQQDSVTSSMPPSSETEKKANQKGTIFCHICNLSVKRSKLAQHLLTFHKQNSPVPSTPERTTKNKKSSGQRNQMSSDLGADSKNRAALDQSFYETRFGGKYMGQIRREGSGRFGSLPLYDDYGDDADAD
jgi:hypothetical protein